MHLESENCCTSTWFYTSPEHVQHSSCFAYALTDAMVLLVYSIAIVHMAQAPQETLTIGNSKASHLYRKTPLRNLRGL